jgi:hypothetical protein
MVLKNSFPESILLPVCIHTVQADIWAVFNLYISKLQNLRDMYHSGVRISFHQYQIKGSNLVWLWPIAHYPHWEFSTSCLLPTQFFPLVQQHESWEEAEGDFGLERQVGLNEVTCLWDSSLLINKQALGFWCLTGALGLEEW